VSVSRFLLRWIGALVLVIGTVNPTGYSYYHWIQERTAENLPIKLIVGVAILIGFVMYLRATWEALGLLGISLAIAFLFAVVWWLIDAQLLDPKEPRVIAWIVLVTIATVMAIGMSWSFVRRKISGQLDTT